MSLFTRRRLHLSVEVDRLALALVRLGRSPTVERELSIEAPINASSPAIGLVGLHAILGQKEWRARPIRIILSDRWIKYFTVDCVPGLRNLGELDELAATRFEHLYGLPSDDWDIEADWGLGTASALACAVPKSLLSAVAGLGHRVESITPFFVAEFNRHRRRIGKSPAWFAVAERHRLTLGFIANGQWRGVRTHAISSWTSETLGEAIQRDHPLFADRDAEVPIFVAGIALPAENLEQGLQVLPAPLWPGKTAAWSKDFRLALAECWA